MKLKTEQEIRELAKCHRKNLYRKWTGNMCMEQASDIEDIVIGTYTQALQDLLASSSEGFDEWYYEYYGTAWEAWQASSISYTKKMQEKDVEINSLKKDLNFLLKGVEYFRPDMKVECENIRVRHNLNKVIKMSTQNYVTKKPIRCTTHFHACDCREYEFEMMKKENEELKKVINKIESNLMSMLECYGDNSKTETIIKNSLIVIKCGVE